jgi:hypothetical protein
MPYNNVAALVEDSDSCLLLDNISEKYVVLKMISEVVFAGDGSCGLLCLFQKDVFECIRRTIDVKEDGKSVLLHDVFLYILLSS